MSLNVIPDQTDAENLAIAFEESELEKEDFLIFCEANDLAVNPEDFNSACRFLEYSYGRRLAWLHIPEDKDVQECLGRVVLWIRLKNLVVVDPDSLCCLVFA